METKRVSGFFVGAIIAFVSGACGDDDGGRSEAQRQGVGTTCSTADDCADDTLDCLTAFTGGYCGLRDCAGDEDCPVGSACVTQGGTNYCFLICVDKPDCNYDRPADAESNCSSNVDLVDGKGVKTCVPPSSG